MRLDFVPALLVALATLAVLALGRRLREGRRRWPHLVWPVLIAGGAVAAVVVRVVEALVLDLVLGQRFSGAAERSGAGVFQTLVAFGLVGPFTVLTLAAIVWPVLGTMWRSGNYDEVDPPLTAACAAAGFVIGRLATQLGIEHVMLGSGVRAAILAGCDVGLAATWGYGLSLSAFDGRLGGSPFGRYAIVAMLVRGAIELSLRSTGTLALPFALSAGALLMIFSAIGVVRLARHGSEVPSSLATVGQETIREIARSELRRGRLRPIWIVVGALGNVGGIVLGFAAAVIVGHSAHVDFGEIDRSGPAAEYAALLLALGVIVSFPLSAAIVGIASGGRERSAQRAHVLEAGIAAILALGALLFVLGIVAPVAVALGVACAPVAFALAGLGAWIAAGRRV